MSDWLVRSKLRWGVFQGGFVSMKLVSELELQLELELELEL